jgi:hypothetical protein
MGIGDFLDLLLTQELLIFLLTGELVQAVVKILKELGRNRSFLAESSKLCRNISQFE